MKWQAYYSKTEKIFFYKAIRFVGLPPRSSIKVTNLFTSLVVKAFQYHYFIHLVILT
jgi:hypothetical protein